MTLATIEEALEDYKAGKMVIIVDDEDRENEGDLVIAAEFATPDAINFMATEGRGLICAPLTGEQIDRLGIPMMVPQGRNSSGFGTGFTISVEAAEGVSTGISAFDRSRTVQVLIDENSTHADIAMPGHMFPLRARSGGVLERRGQTEASVDMSRLAGLKPAAVICEIMSADGEMSRLPEILAFGRKHDIKTISVNALVEYRLKIGDTLGTAAASGIVRFSEASLPTKHGQFKAVAYRDLHSNEEHLALTMGDLTAGDAPLVRLRSECLTGDVLGSLRCDCGEQLQLALQRIAETGRGAVVYLKQEGRGIGLANKIRAYALQEQGLDTVDANLHLGFPADARSYGVAAAILQDLQVPAVRLMTNNPTKVEGLERQGVAVTERVAHEVTAVAENKDYLQTKKEKMGHLLH